MSLDYVKLHYVKALCQDIMSSDYVKLHYVKALCQVIMSSDYVKLHYVKLHYVKLHYVKLHYVKLHYVNLEKRRAAELNQGKKLYLYAPRKNAPLNFQNFKKAKTHFSDWPPEFSKFQKKQKRIFETRRLNFQKEFGHLYAPCKFDGRNSKTNRFTLLHVCQVVI